jgi:hypothetical protein
MKASLFILLLSTLGCISCGQSTHTPPENVENSPSTSGKNIEYDKDIYSSFEYTDTKGKRVLFQNGYPRGGRKYNDPKGNDCSYAVFWTQIINETDTPLEMDINCPAQAYEISNFPGKYFKILVPPDTMTLERNKDLNVIGLESFFERTIDRPSLVKRTIHPNESSGFYFVMLVLTQEATGMTRAELQLKGQDLMYTIKRYSITKPSTLMDEIEFKCGSIHLKELHVKP